MPGLFSRARPACLCLAAIALAQPRAVAADTPPPPLHFDRATLDATGETPEICLHFDQPLKRQDNAALAAAIHLAPDARPAVRVEDRMLCLGGLAFDQRYQVTIGTAILSAAGGHLAAPVTLAASFGNRPAHVAIAGNGFILPGHATAGVTVQSVNVHAVRLHVFRMQPHMRFPGTGQDGGVTPDLSQTTMESWTFRSLLGQDLSEVWHGTMAVDGAANRTAETAFPLADIVDRRQPGLYLVTAEDAAVAPASSPVEAALRAARGHADQPGGDLTGSREFATHWVDLSDLGLTMLRGEDGLTVGVRSLASSLPVAGATLTLRGRDGGILGTVHTDRAGAARFAAPLLRGRAAHEPVLLIAEQDDDIGFLRLDRQWFDFSEHGAAGSGERHHSAVADGLVRALVQPDRGLYRPGEIVRLLVLMRDRAGRAAGGLRPSLILRRPDMTRDRVLPLAADQAGGYAVALPLDATAPLGQWRAEIRLDPTMPPLGSAGFAVRDFVPQVIAADFSAPSAVSPGQTITVDATVRFLYGAPGAGLRSDSHYRVIPAPDPVADYRGWSFGLENEDMAPIGGDIDAPPAGPDGHARLAFTPDIPPGLTRPLAVALDAGFLDPLGQRVGQQRLIAIRRTAPLIGLHVAARGSDSGQSGPVPVDIALLSPDDRPVPAAALHWTVSRLNRIYDWSHDGGNGWTFTSHVIDVPMRAGDVTTDGHGRARVSPVLDWGEYRLTANDPASGAATSVRFTVGWAARAEDEGAPDRLVLSVRDAHVAPGAGTVLHIGGGIAGQALVTLATDHVLSMQTVDVPKEGLSVPLTATPDWQSGVYALVTLYRPLAGPAATSMRPHDPVRAVGLAWIGVDQEKHRLAVTLDAPRTVEPRRRLTVPVTIHGAGGAPAGAVRVVVAAVDQGILNLTHFRPLDMFDMLFGQQRLGLDMLDNYGALLLGDAKAGHIRSGGDASGDEEGESGPPIRRRASVALFDGPVSLDASGHGHVSFDVPDFDGQLHLMATAWSDDAVGNAERDVIARDPVFPDLGLPRFMAPGDSVQALVTLVDTTAPPGTYTVRLSTDGPLRLTGASTFETALAPGMRKETRLPLAADPTGPGGAEGHVHLTLRRAGSATTLLERHWPITIRPGHMPVTASDGAWLQPGGRHVVARDALAGFDAAETHVTLGLSASAGIDTVGLLQSLPRTLWGPSDTLAAQARALLQVTDPAMLGPHETAATVGDRVRSVIETLFDRQNAAGAIGQWQANDGRTLPDDLDYLADFLIRAKAAGYPVPADRLDLLLDQIDAEQMRPMSFTGGPGPRLSVLNTRAYAAYVLARAGRLHPDAIHDLAASLVARTQQGHTTLLWAESEAGDAQAGPQALGHLAAALRLADAPDDGGATAPGGLFDAAIAALGPERTGPPGVLDAGYWAYARDLASLAALAAEAHDDTRARLLIDRFGRLTVAPESLTGQSRTALLEAARAMDQDTAGRAVRVDGHAPPPLRLPAFWSLTPAMLDRGVPVDNTGQKPLFVTLTRHGVPDGDATPAARGLTLEQAGYTLDGAPFDLAHMRQTDRFIVSLKGTAPLPGRYQVVLTSLLPAGWEIESVIPPSDAAPDRAEDDESRGRHAPYGFLGPLTGVDKAAIRDDRLTVTLRFDTRNPRQARRGFQIAYIARATMPGRFVRPEAVVSGRFRPSLMARTASGTVDIAPR
ncbi:alpha-2-macroglobulin [Gluconacetobacter sacchari DSM 12717]|uniref:Alpha-2-macroglobulin family protein n=2 Tax=Gluconacetobacter sacchari TaxID=92759 RepID=A0A7W4IAN9_9PROT|nr:MG2 domain-containing protein [Gluconacetobacter sacchari]MBB2159406.1 hypothetical protein [Gluconacetobacter sacchari]GBQ20002.1 alpha-2-macroglobulin [Gluconacetobacter sacchari DSM 12717]